MMYSVLAICHRDVSYAGLRNEKTLYIAKFMKYIAAMGKSIKNFTHNFNDSFDNIAER